MNSKDKQLLRHIKNSVFSHKRDRESRPVEYALMIEKFRKDGNYLCSFCGNSILTITDGRANTNHHKIPLRYDGENSPDNLFLICNKCHNILETLIVLVEERALFRSYALGFKEGKAVFSTQDAPKVFKKDYIIKGDILEDE